MPTFRKLVLGTILSVAAAVVSMPASAQDYNRWGGLYFGANAGWQSTDFDWKWDNPLVTTGAETPQHDNGIYGGHVGFQHQWGQIVVGVETAFSGTGRFGSGFDGSTCNVNAVYACEGGLRNLFTIGPRIGWAPSDQWLLFATGGYALGGLQTQAVLLANGVAVERTTERHDGWFVGGGVEFALTRNIILGAEYQRVSLDTELHSVTPATDNRQVSADIDIVRARLSFKLGRAEERYEPMK